MKSQRVCPFYGRDDELCDVGSGYISPYHAEIMVRHCTSRYEDCGRYQELATGKFPQEKDNRLEHSSQAAQSPTGGLLLPLQLDPEVVPLVHHKIRTPLTSIRSFTEILLTYPIDDPDAQRRFLSIIKDEAERLSHAVDILFGSAESDARCPAEDPAKQTDRNQTPDAQACPDP